MNPVIYPATETAFTTRGYGTLSDCVSCIVTEELNGAYTLELKYPKNGIHQEDLLVRNIIVCSPNKDTDREAFRIYKVNRQLRDYITVYANQLSYDLSGYPAYIYTGVTTDMMNLKTSPIGGTTIKTMSAGTKLEIWASRTVNGALWYKVEEQTGMDVGWCQGTFVIVSKGTYPRTVYSLEDAIGMLNMSSGDFAITTSKTSDTEFVLDMPSSVRSWFGGKEGSLIDLYGGEWEYSFRNCYLRDARGGDYGARISYGVNIAQYMKEISDQAYTHIVPYFAKQNGDRIVSQAGDEIATGFSGATNKLLVDVSGLVPSEYGGIVNWCMAENQRKNHIGSGTIYPLQSLGTSTLYFGFNPNSTSGSLSGTSITYEGVSGETDHARIDFSSSRANTGVGIPVPVVGGLSYRMEVSSFLSGSNSYIKIVYVTAAGARISASEAFALPSGDDLSSVMITFSAPANAAYAIITPYGTGSSSRLEVSFGALECVPTVAEVTTAGQTWLAKHPIIPDGVTISVEPEVLATSVSLGDTVHVCYDDALFDTRVIRTVWDTLKEKYAKLDLGTKKTTLTDTIKSLNSGGISQASGGSSSGGAIDVGIVDVKVNGTSVSSGGVANVTAVTDVKAGSSSVVSGGVATLGNVAALTYTVISTF